jgi:hypothetical protein
MQRNAEDVQSILISPSKMWQKFEIFEKIVIND